MKILFITSSSINGGAQKHIREMFKSLSDLDNEVFLVAPEGWLVDELKVYGDRIIPLELNLKTRDNLISVIESIKPDITNTFILSGGVFGTLAWKKKKYGKLFVTVNNPVIYPGISSSSRIIYPLLYRWMSKYASAFLVKADKVRDEVDDVIHHKKPVISIKNGVDFQVFDKDKEYPDIRADLCITKEDIVITNVAAIDIRKGQQYLIEAVQKLRENYPVHVLLVGEGDDEVRLRSIVKKMGAGSYIHFLGRRNDINVILSNSDIFVLSSLHEGLPNALMEAMAMGLPCVATDVGGVRQLIKYEGSGLVINAGDETEIKNAINEMISIGEKGRVELGERGRQVIFSEYEKSLAVKELESIYTHY